MSDLSTDNTLRERTDVNEYWFWLLLGTNRRAVAGGLAFLIFLVFMIWGVLQPVSLYPTMQSSDIVETLFAGPVGAIITGTTLVVTINQLILSQEIGSLGSQRSRMDTTMDFRQNTDSLLETTTPADPAAYLHALIETSERRAEALQNALSETENQELYEKVDEYVSDLLENADHARNHLEDADFGTFDVVLIEQMPASGTLAEATAQRVFGRDTEHVLHVQASQLEIRGRGSDPITFSLDGELNTHDELVLYTDPQSLTVCVGSTYEDTHSD